MVLPALRSARSAFAARAFPVLAALLTVTVVACGASRGVDEEHGSGSARVERPPAVFVIDSRLVGPVNVYATSGVARVRLGTINVSQEVRWPVPRDMVGRGRTVRLLLDQIGGPSVATERFAVEDGDVVRLTVTHQIFQSPSTLRVQIGG